MADRTALTAGIAAASIAAVVAASPALITPNTQDMQVTASAAAAQATKKLSTDVQLVAFTLPGLFDAFLNGHYDPEERYGKDLVDADLADAIANGDVNGADPVAVANYRAALVDAYTLPGFSGAIYYTLDSSLPEDFDYDDAFAVLGLQGFLELLAADLNVSPLFDLVSNPVGTALAVAQIFGLPTEIADFAGDPAGTAFELLEGLGLPGAVEDFLSDPTSVLPPEVAELLENPAITVVVLANALGVLPDVAAGLLSDPVGTVFDVAEGLGVDPIVRAFATDPIGTLLSLIPAQQAITTFGETAPTEKISTLETKAPKLVDLKLPTPAEVVSQIESNVDSAVTDFKAAVTPKKFGKPVVESLVAVDEDEDEDAPKTEKFGKKIDFDGPVAKLATGVSKSLKAASEERAEKRAERAEKAKERHADRVDSFKKKFGGSDESGE